MKIFEIPNDCWKIREEREKSYLRKRFPLKVDQLKEERNAEISFVEA